VVASAADRPHHDDGDLMLPIEPRDDGAPEAVGVHGLAEAGRLLALSSSGPRPDGRRSARHVRRRLPEQIGLGEPEGQRGSARPGSEARPHLREAAASRVGEVSAAA
jgi:hypothetical protein